MLIKKLSRRLLKGKAIVIVADVLGYALVAGSNEWFRSANTRSIFLIRWQWFLVGDVPKTFQSEGEK